VGKKTLINKCHIFVSRSNVSPASLDEAQLYLRARSRNDGDGISGLLHHEGGCWTQYSDGPTVKVEGMLLRVRTDWRHHSFKDVSCEHSNEPIFAGFLMPMLHWQVISFALFQFQHERSGTEIYDAAGEDIVEYFRHIAAGPYFHWH
jgi:hypothetical protein